jgi:hypothetical protein
VSGVVYVDRGAEGGVDAADALEWSHKWDDGTKDFVLDVAAQVC